jgi:hypothetical protein
MKSIILKHLETLLSLNFFSNFCEMWNFCSLKVKKFKLHSSQFIFISPQTSQYIFGQHNYVFVIFLINEKIYENYIDGEKGHLQNYSEQLAETHSQKINKKC